jgi:hypothetical protein
MMAAMSFGDQGKDLIRKRGFIRANEAAAGSGAMVIAYLQLSLLHVPAVIVHGNTLSSEEWSNWYTPAHILGGWEWRLRRRAAEDGAHEIIAAPVPAERASVAPLPVSADEASGSGKPVQLALF